MIKQAGESPGAGKDPREEKLPKTEMVILKEEEPAMKLRW